MRDLLFVACASTGIALVACGAAAPPIHAGRTDPNSPSTPHAVDPPYFPGFGASDVDHHEAAFAGNGALTFVSLGDGAVRWTNAESWFLAPLVVDGDRVYAAERAGDHALDVATLDAKDGKIVAHSQPIELPPWASIAPTGGAETNASARIDDAGALVVHWTASTSYWGGVAPTPQIIAASTHHAEGAARVDLATGAPALLSDDDAKHEGELQARTPPELGKLPPELPAEAQYGGPVIIGDRLYYVTSPPITSNTSTTETVLHAFDMEHHVALWQRVVRHDPVFMPPP